MSETGGASCGLGQRPVESGEASPLSVPNAVLDLSRASLFEISVWLYEHEVKDVRITHRYDTWPQPVRAQVERVAKEWSERNPKRALIAVTTALVNDRHRKNGRNAVVLFHHVEGQG